MVDFYANQRNPTSLIFLMKLGVFLRFKPPLNVFTTIKNLPSNLDRWRSNFFGAPLIERMPLSCCTFRGVVCRVVAAVAGVTVGAGFPMVKIFLGALGGAVEGLFALEAAYDVWFGHRSTSRSCPTRTMTGMSERLGAGGFGLLNCRI
jgi:hypothetical protein